MKKLILILSILLIKPAFANYNTVIFKSNNATKQGYLNPEEKSRKRVEKLDVICTLTPSQKTVLLQINTEYFIQRNQMQKAKQSKEAIKNLAHERNQKEMKLLTKEQLSKLKAYRQQQVQNKVRVESRSNDEY